MVASSSSNPEPDAAPQRPGPDRSQLGNQSAAESGQAAVDGSAATNQKQPGSQEPSLGPACLVFAILTLALICVFCGFGSWIMFNDQYPYAEQAMTQQLIPWVEASQLAEDDKRSILNQLEGLLPVVRDREIDKQQLLRLRNCLQDNPVLLWGNIQSIIAQAPNTELTKTELSTLERIEQRLLRMAAQRRLGRRDLEFTIQDFSRVRSDGLGLEVRSNLTADEIREFMKRAEGLLERNQASNESYDKSPGEVFEIMIDDALHPP